MDKLQQRMARLGQFMVAGQTPRPEGRSTAPHPIPRGKEGTACPITGLTANGQVSATVKPAFEAFEALAALESDPDIQSERLKQSQLASQQALPVREGRRPRSDAQALKFVPLNVIDRSHRASQDTRRLVREIGGLPTLRRFTTLFYKKAFADVTLDKFIHSHDDPHGERFATWIAEKFGDGTPWSDERATRKETYLQVGQRRQEVSFDRSSAHFAAWFSPKREPHKLGQKFKLDDSRNWMRIHFWAAREAGLFEPQYAAFMDYYIRFIGHFMSVYTSAAPPFTRESVRWSANPANIEKYLAAGNLMTDIIGVEQSEALAALPAEERSRSWPYQA